MSVDEYSGEGVHVGPAWLEEEMFKLPVLLKFPIVKEPTVSKETVNVILRNYMSNSQWYP